MKNKAKIGEFKPGKKTVLNDEDLDLAKGKFRVTIWVDTPMLDKFRDFAKASGGKYQTLLNECLNEYVDLFLRERAERISSAYLRKSSARLLKEHAKSGR